METNVQLWYFKQFRDATLNDVSTQRKPQNEDFFSKFVLFY